VSDVPEAVEEVSCRGTRAAVADGAMKATRRNKFGQQCMGYVQATRRADERKWTVGGGVRGPALLNLRRTFRRRNGHSAIFRNWLPATLQIRPRN
jgi:hypothetical protein